MCFMFLQFSKEKYILDTPPEKLHKELEEELKLNSSDLRSHAWYHGRIPREVMWRVTSVIVSTFHLKQWWVSNLYMFFLCLRCRRAWCIEMGTFLSETHWPAWVTMCWPVDGRTSLYISRSTRWWWKPATATPVYSISSNRRATTTSHPWCAIMSVAEGQSQIRAAHSSFVPSIVHFHYDTWRPAMGSPRAGKALRAHRRGIWREEVSPWLMVSLQTRSPRAMAAQTGMDISYR